MVWLWTAFGNCVDQDKTVQNVQIDLDPHRPLSRTDRQSYRYPIETIMTEKFGFIYLVANELTHSLIHRFETVPNSKKLQTTTEM